jgi:hypothetical protein
VACAFDLRWHVRILASAGVPGRERSLVSPAAAGLIYTRMGAPRLIDAGDRVSDSHRLRAGAARRPDRLGNGPCGQKRTDASRCRERHAGVVPEGLRAGRRVVAHSARSARDQHELCRHRRDRGQVADPERCISYHDLAEVTLDYVGAAEDRRDDAEPQRRPRQRAVHHYTTATQPSWAASDSATNRPLACRRSLANARLFAPAAPAVSTFAKNSNRPPHQRGAVLL